MLPTGVSNWIRDSAPPAVSGSGGHDATYRVACSLWRMLDDEAAVWAGLLEYNATKCQPAWSEKELRHKLADAEKATRGERQPRPQRRAGPSTSLRATLADMRRVLAQPPKGARPPAPVAIPASSVGARPLRESGTNQASAAALPDPVASPVPEVASPPAELPDRPQTGVAELPDPVASPVPEVARPPAECYDVAMGENPHPSLDPAVLTAHMAALPAPSLRSGQGLPPRAERDYLRLTQVLPVDRLPPDCVRVTPLPGGRALATWHEPKRNYGKTFKIQR